MSALRFGDGRSSVGCSPRDAHLQHGTAFRSPDIRGCCLHWFCVHCCCSGPGSTGRLCQRCWSSCIAMACDSPRIRRVRVWALDGSRCVDHHGSSYCSGCIKHRPRHQTPTSLSSPTWRVPALSTRYTLHGGYRSVTAPLPHYSSAPLCCAAASPTQHPSPHTPLSVLSRAFQCSFGHVSQSVVASLFRHFPSHTYMYEHPSFRLFPRCQPPNTPHTPPLTAASSGVSHPLVSVSVSQPCTPCCLPCCLTRSTGTPLHPP